MIDERLVEKLKDVFPKSFTLVREYEKYDYIPGPWGIEKVFNGIGVEYLSEDILSTAEAFRKKYGIERAINYLQPFAKKSVQKSQSRGFYEEI